jgi:hypothetical protein
VEQHCLSTTGASYSGVNIGECHGSLSHADAEEKGLDVCSKMSLSWFNSPQTKAELKIHSMVHK